MARVRSAVPSSDWMGHAWPHAGAVVEMDDGEAAALLEIAGPDGGYEILPEPKKAAAKPAAAEDQGGAEG